MPTRKSSLVLGLTRWMIRGLVLDPNVSLFSNRGGVSILASPIAFFHFRLRQLVQRVRESDTMELDGRVSLKWICSKEEREHKARLRFLSRGYVL